MAPLTNVQFGFQNLANAWRLLHCSALAMVVTLSPFTHDHAGRRKTAEQICWTTRQVLPGFTLLSTLLSLVLIRVVTVTALSYGLSHYALEMVVRVLVVELIPLSAALYVSVRYAAATAAAVAASVAVNRNSGDRLHAEFWRHVLAPRLIASAFAVLMLVAVSSALVLIITYLGLYGPSPWGVAGFTRTIGQIFNVEVALGFALKCVLFSLAVGVIPISVSVSGRSSIAFLGSIGHVLLVLVLIEVASLMIKFL